MKWGDFIARTAVRRVIWIVVGLAVYALLGLFSAAHAACVSSRINEAVCDTRPEAYAFAAGLTDPVAEACLSGQGRSWEYFLQQHVGSKTVAQRMRWPEGGCGQSAGYARSVGAASWVEECPAGTAWHDELRICAPTDCASRSEETGWDREQSGPNVCSGGCLYTHVLDVAGNYYEATGGVCTVSDDTPAPTPAEPTEPPEPCDGEDCDPPCEGDDCDPGGGDGGGGDGGGGDGGGDGGGPGGPGGGDGDGDGDGDGGGDGDGDGGGGGGGGGDGPGSPGQGIPDGFYEGDERTLSELYDDFKERVSNAPIIGATSRMFETPQGGSCPVFTLEASYYWQAMVFDWHCRPPLSDVLALAGWLVLAIATFFAIRIAIE